MAARSSCDLVQPGRSGAAGLRGGGRRRVAVVPAAGRVRRSGRPSVTDGDFRWSWYLPAARSALVRSLTTRYWSEALFTATAAIVSGLAVPSPDPAFVE